MGQRFVGSFDDLIDEVMYPIFDENFSKKYSYLHNINNDSRYHKVVEIDTVGKCHLNGEDCIAALNSLDDLLYRCFGKFSVLNQDLNSDNAPSKLTADRYYGTLLANMNFQLANDQPTTIQQNVATFQLELELRRLINTLIPSQTMTLTEIIGSLGYSDVIWSQNKGSNPRRAGVIQKQGLPFRNEKNSSCDIESFLVYWNNHVQDVLNALNTNKEKHSFAGTIQYY